MKNKQLANFFNIKSLSVSCFLNNFLNFLA